MLKKHNINAQRRNSMNKMIIIYLLWTSNFKCFVKPLCVHKKVEILF